MTKKITTHLKEWSWKPDDDAYAEFYENLTEEDVIHLVERFGGIARATITIVYDPPTSARWNGAPA